MAQAVNAIQQGFDYQARLFWLFACRMLAPNSRVCRVGYDVTDVKGFDDVVVEYEPPVIDATLNCRRGLHQVKFHVNPTHSVTAADLTDPKFIGAEETSLLQRLLEVQKLCLASNTPFTAHFWTTAPVTPTDVLARLISNETDTLDLKKLCQGSAKTKFGILREQWRKHLSLKSLEDLLEVLRPLRLHHGFGSLNLLGSTLATVLGSIGLVPPSQDSPANPYDELIRKLRRQGDGYFAAQQLRDACRAAGLLQEQPASTRSTRCIGLRSFRPWAEFLDEEADKLLTLMDRFDGRELRAPHNWSQVVVDISAFLEQNANSTVTNNLFICAHQTIAFAAGYSLPAKAGIRVRVSQSTAQGRELWDISDNGADSGACVTKERLRPGADDLALALSATHDVEADVLAYVNANLPSVGALIQVRPLTGPSISCIRDGAQAAAWCRNVHNALVNARQEFKGTIHVFAACPNALFFGLGRIALNWGRIQLYEFTFNDADQRNYLPSAMLPVK